MNVCLCSCEKYVFTTETVYGLDWSERKGHWREERLWLSGEETQDNRARTDRGDTRTDTSKNVTTWTDKNDTPHKDNCHLS